MYDVIVELQILFSTGQIYNKSRGKLWDLLIISLLP